MSQVRERGGARSGWSVLAAVAVAWGCAGGPAPATAPPVADDPPELSEASPEARAEAEAEGVDQQRLEEAAAEAEQVVGGLDEVSRREFQLLFGDDPLGLEDRPANAARFEIPLETNEQVEFWIDYFQNRIPERFATYLSRLGRYEGLIRERLQAAELPEDLIYLALIESGMNPNAYSRAHAVGMWQFIRGTARRYGLEVSWWLDERRDPVLATEAAIAHLADLYEEFGSWYLAAAAYNGGPGRVTRGIARTGSTDFWELADARVLRRETRNYVPKLIAAAIIARDPAAYGFDDVEPEPEWRYETVEVADATSFDVIAEAAGASEAEIRELNPQFPRQVTPPGVPSRVRVPAGRSAGFAAAYAAIPPTERVTWLEHVVTRGQTLSHIARRYGTSVNSIRAANDWIQPRRLQIGQRLVIPRAGGRTRLASGGGTSAPAPSGPITITVRRGDTLWAIGRRYDVSTSELMALNNLSSSRILPGDRITVRR